MSEYAGPDVEGAVKRYLQQAPSVLSGPAADRTFLAVKKPTFPYITVIRIGGGEDGSEVPADTALLQIDVLGRIGELAEANEVRRGVRVALARLDENPFDDANNARLLGAIIRDERRFPEPDAQDPGGVIGERPRYIITTEVYAVGIDALV